MHPEEYKTLKKIAGAIQCVSDLAYFTGKHGAYHELQYALDQVSQLVTTAVKDKMIRETLNEDDLSAHIEELIKIVAAEKLRAGLDLKAWQKYCKLTMIGVAESQTETLTAACKLLRCGRETVYYARGQSSRSKRAS